MKQQLYREDGRKDDYAIAVKIPRDFDSWRNLSPWIHDSRWTAFFFSVRHIHSHSPSLSLSFSFFHPFTILSSLSNTKFYFNFLFIYLFSCILRFVIRLAVLIRAFLTPSLWPESNESQYTRRVVHLLSPYIESKVGFDGVQLLCIQKQAVFSLLTGLVGPVFMTVKQLR